ncbi:MAG: hypothetical protein K0U72_11405 [Gammaproteobacteria bacterium]|nr:hypothetical protein [Gammaproteobacteria bacterium]
MKIRLRTRPVDVLLVVGDLQAVREIRQTLDEAQVTGCLHHIGDLDEARAYLRREEPYEDAPKPGLIIYEASLRRNVGIDLLAEVKAAPELADAQVIVLAGIASQNRLFEKCFYSSDSYTDEPVSLPELAQLLLAAE